jgi:uncharacterized protein (DUF885 family)
VRGKYKTKMGMKVDMRELKEIISKRLYAVNQQLEPSIRKRYAKELNESMSNWMKLTAIHTKAEREARDIQDSFNKKLNKIGFSVDMRMNRKVEITAQYRPEIPKATQEMLDKIEFLMAIKGVNSTETSKLIAELLKIYG